MSYHVSKKNLATLLKIILPSLLWAVKIHIECINTYKIKILKNVWLVNCSQIINSSYM